MPRAARYSVPGGTQTHWSAFAAVRDCRGPTNTNRFFAAALRGMERSKLPGILNRRQPGFKKISAKGDQKVRMVYPVCWNAVNIKYFLICPAQRFIGEGLIGHKAVRIQFCKPLKYQIPERSILESAEKHCFVLLAGLFY